MQARFAIACDATSCPSAIWFPLRFGNAAGHSVIANCWFRQNVQLRNKVSQMLMESGVVYNKQKLHKVGYFKELMETNQDIGRALRPLLTICRETIVRIGKTESALIRSLRRDPLLQARVERLMTIPAVGPITALTWVLEVDDVARFHSVKQAVSYCGLCGAERSSAETIKRMPISKQRNKHLQSVLIEAAKLGPRLSPDLALIYDTEKHKDHANRASIAVARKLVAYLLAVDRSGREFVVAREREAAAEAATKYKQGSFNATCQVPQLPTGRRSSCSQGLPSKCFGTGR
jgi:transposase